MEGDIGDILVGLVLSPVLCVSQQAVSSNLGLLACEAWSPLAAVEPAAVCAAQPGTSARTENPKDAGFVLISAGYVGKPHGLERFVCVEPSAV